MLCKRNGWVLRVFYVASRWALVVDRRGDFHYVFPDPAVFVCGFSWHFDFVGVVFLAVFEGCACGFDWIFGGETGVEE